MGLIDHSIVVDNERHDSRVFGLRWITSIRRERRGVMHPSAVVIRMLQARNQGGGLLQPTYSPLNATSSMSEG